MMLVAFVVKPPLARCLLMACAASASSVTVARLMTKPITLMSRVKSGNSDVFGGCGSTPAVTMIFPPEAVIGSIGLSGIRPEVSQQMVDATRCCIENPGGEIGGAEIEQRAGSLLEAAGMVAGTGGGDHPQACLTREPDQRRPDAARCPSDEDGLSRAGARPVVQAD
jgi:hypothetical protein